VRRYMDTEQHNKRKRGDEAMDVEERRQAPWIDFEYHGMFFLLCIGLFTHFS
jgi:hypothetical protein